MDKNYKIGIVGLGLIGGSILKVLHKDFETYVVSQSKATIEKAKKYSRNVSLNLDVLKPCSIIFVCTPMNKTIEMLDKLESVLSADTIVADVSSLKCFLCDKKRPYKFIPTHPMAGTEFSGFDNSFDSLFNSAKWVLTPLEETSVDDANKLVELIEFMGAVAVFATPSEHDEAVALISHMPMLISQAIFKTAQGNDLALKLAASGFRDMTRLTLSNEEMAEDMMNLNSDNIQTSVLKLYSSVGELLGKDYKEQITKIKKCRHDMYLDGKNIVE
jgi:prephenate dehydrogenase